MKMQAENLQLTAYALGELKDERARTDIETALENSPELRRELERIRRTATLLEKELSREAIPDLTEVRRRKIESSLFPERRSVFRWRSNWGPWAGLAAAASISIMIYLTLGSDEGFVPYRKAVKPTAEVEGHIPIQPPPGLPPRIPPLPGPTAGEVPPDSLKTEEVVATFGLREPISAIEGRKPSLSSPHGAAVGSGAPVPESGVEKAGMARKSSTKPGEQVRSEMVASPQPLLIQRRQVTGEVASPVPTPSSAPSEVAEVLHLSELATRARGMPGRAAGGIPGGVAGGVVGGIPEPPPPPAKSAPAYGVVRITDMPSMATTPDDFNTEAYDRIKDNPFLSVTHNPLSTFSIDVDTASYSNMRRFLRDDMLPPKDSVRIEEMLNYFSYRYDEPSGEDLFAAKVEVASAPWTTDHRLVQIGLKAKEVAEADRPASNLVFLLDVSGSMQPVNKLPLLQKAFRLLVEKLRGKDRVAIVVYAGASGLVLPPTSGDRKEKILQALDNLRAGGSTNGGSGIQLAYQTAVSHFTPDGINRVILATDGDFNIGITDQGNLIRLVEEQAKSGVFLSVLGFGTGNVKDSTMEKLADKGNGHYAYIDRISEARKVLVEEMGSTLMTVAKDVKIQIEFNPARASAYRLIGYENRLLRAEDFNDDTKDAGEIGAGHTVTALYEVVPVGVPMQLPSVDPLKYTSPIQSSSSSSSDELVTVKLRYKRPDGQTSQLMEHAVEDSGQGYEQASPDFRFTAAVASFGMILRESPHRGSSSFEQVLELARGALGTDWGGYREEFMALVRKADWLKKEPDLPPGR